MAIETQKQRMIKGNYVALVTRTLANKDTKWFSLSKLICSSRLSDTTSTSAVTTVAGTSQMSTPIAKGNHLIISLRVRRDTMLVIAHKCACLRVSLDNGR